MLTWELCICRLPTEDKKTRTEIKVMAVALCKTWAHKEDASIWVNSTLLFLCIYKKFSFSLKSFFEFLKKKFWASQNLILNSGNHQGSKFEFGVETYLWLVLDLLQGVVSPWAMFSPICLTKRKIWKDIIMSCEQRNIISSTVYVMDLGVL